jgi:HEAT repeat protein
LAVPLLRCAIERWKSGDAQAAAGVFRQLSAPGQPQGVRRAALTSLLDVDPPHRTTTIFSWLADSDPDRRLVAAGQLPTIPDDQLDSLLARLSELPDGVQLAVLEVAAARRGAAVLPTVVEMVASDRAEAQLAGIRCLGMVGDASVVPLLVDKLAGEEAIVAAAQEALVKLPRGAVTAALLDALRQRPEIRVPVIAVLVQLRCYDAIDPLIEIALDSDPSVYQPALEGLRGIADPDKTDLPRLVKLLLMSTPGRQRDEVEKTILIVTDKLPAGADRSELVRATLAAEGAEETIQALPLLGRLGGAASLEAIRTALASSDAPMREAAVRGLCNWPNADVAEQLLELASQAENDAWRRWALRAYMRVVTLPSERPEVETLHMLQSATELARVPEDRQLAIERASAVRTLPSVRWIATYLDDPELNQVACEAIVELAHHRFLRHPNMDTFGPLLDRVAEISTDPEVVQRAKRYRLGL